MTTRKYFSRALALLAAIALLASCATSSYRPGVVCAAAGFSVTDNFEGARRGKCSILSDDHVAIEIRPESDGYINDSPWYAFKVEPAGGNWRHDLGHTDLNRDRGPFKQPETALIRDQAY